MGIPAYFAYLVRNYPEIMRKYKRVEAPIDYFYIDANSTVYDVIYGNEQLSQAVADKTIAVHYDLVIEETIKSLTKLIVVVGASQTYIAFDGVAPCAKMEQQRQRRARAAIDGKGITFITPGTDFMCKLNVAVYNAFRDIKGVMVSGADVAGEGEHKIFEQVRTTMVAKQSRVAIYGLDADLIILALCHMEYCGDICLLRKDDTVDSNDVDKMIMVKICIFAEKIKELGVNVRDYIFMSFFLGNDFMPHFPALSIRSDGIIKLLDTYKEITQGGSVADSIFTDKIGQPLWVNVRHFIGALAKKEADWIYFDYLERNKMEARMMADVEASGNVENTPLLNRGLEKYVAPEYPNWEARYYKALLDGVDVRKLVCNWTEGLEWVMKYYVGGVPDWKWKYDAHYPPLFVDIYKHMPMATNNECFFGGDSGLATMPMSAQEQLDYVMPRRGDTIKIEWAYCRYLWESHTTVIHK